MLNQQDMFSEPGETLDDHLEDLYQEALKHITFQTEWNYQQAARKAIDQYGEASNWKYHHQIANHCIIIRMKFKERFPELYQETYG